ncbi:MAG TPA: iron export ABC transporter permease subunit FetB [Atribacteraceae bacterium]|nr:iron export ABC transporter permease subunit FetB [Atribacteraceae bacterium]
MNGVIEIGLLPLALAYVFVLVLLLYVRARRINREREILVSSIRMTLQLMIAGHLLAVLFENPHPLLTVAAVLVMEGFAVQNIIRRVKVPLSYRLKRIIAFSMTSGTLVSLFFFLLFVVGLRPWYEPRYFIPIAGMIIGNSMTGISLGVNRLVDGIITRQDLVEAALMLGATPREAVRRIVDAAFDAAFLPTINSMTGMGIVFLPGMMTGQILSGVSPITAIEYQIAIMLGILGGVAFTVILFVHFGASAFFNDRAQLVYPTEVPDMSDR